MPGVTIVLGLSHFVSGGTTNHTRQGVKGRVDGGVSDTDVKDVLGLVEQTYGGEVAFLSAEVVRVARLAQLRSL